MEEQISFTPNPLLDKELHKFPAVSTNVDEAAEAIAARAREMAPVVTGRYRDGIVVNKANGKGVARVAATDQKSSWVEFGTATEPPQFVMRQAVESLGYQFKKSSR
jgi:Bacteriophage HK97-gp10, putative tail-component